MKKIVSAFVLVFMFSVFSVTGFALVLDSHNTNPNYTGVIKSLDVFETFTNDVMYKEYKTEFDEIRPFLENNPYFFIGSPDVNSTLLYVAFCEKEMYFDPVSHSPLMVNDRSNTSCKGGFIGFRYLKDKVSILDFNSRDIVSLPIEGDFIGVVNFGRVTPNTGILYCNFDMKDIYGNIVFNATEKTHNSTDPPYTGDIKVKWKNFGDRTTDTGINEYLNFSGNSLQFDLSVGDISTSDCEFNLLIDDVGNPSGGIDFKNLINLNNIKPILSNTTSSFDINLSAYNVKLKDNVKYSLKLQKLDTFGEKIVSNIGFVYKNPNIRTVSWSTFGNRTTSKGEYLPLDGLFMKFQLYTGDIENHNYNVYIQEFNKKGQTVGDKVDIISDFFSNPLKKYSTYNMSFYLPKHLSLDGGHKFVFYIKDITNGEIVSSIGFSPVIGIRKRNDVPPNLEIMTEIPNDSVDTEIKPPFSDIGTGDNPNFPSENFPETGGIGEKISWFFNSILNVINVIFSSFTNLLDVVSSSCTSFVNFLGSMFPYLPKELTMCISLGFTAIIVLRFLKR